MELFTEPPFRAYCKQTGFFELDKLEQSCTEIVNCSQKASPTEDTSIESRNI